MGMRSKKTGFTLLEVMFSLVVFMVAISGLAMLQRVSVQGSQMGKRHTAAVNVASFFLTQLQNEISNWLLQDNQAGFPANRYPLLTQAYTNTGQWQILSQGNAEFRVGEFLGHSSLAGGNGSSRFCVGYRIRPLEAIPSAVANNNRVVVWEARVRVSWTMDRLFDGSTWMNCTPASVTSRITAGNDRVVELVGVATREIAR
ncbi:MAG: type II secretion system protein [Planctomycetes bacterium]|nr:type II secretion system protein [Planctomycetota bacterium]